MADEPSAQFGIWYEVAKAAGIHEPEAMALATASAEGAPSVRMVLMRGADDKGFRFYTNYYSRKGIELEENPRAAGVIHWKELERQVRIEGRVEKLSREESNAYFQGRPRGSRIGAWASAQSKVIQTRADLEAAVADVEARFGDGEVPLPPYWGGFLIVPEVVEFWQGRPSRLHDRIRYTRTDGGWKLERLSP